MALVREGLYQRLRALPSPTNYEAGPDASPDPAQSASGYNCRVNHLHGLCAASVETRLPSAPRYGVRRSPHEPKAQASQIQPLKTRPPSFAGIWPIRSRCRICARSTRSSPACSTSGNGNYSSIRSNRSKPVCCARTLSSPRSPKSSSR